MSARPQRSVVVGAAVAGAMSIWVSGCGGADESAAVAAVEAVAEDFLADVRVGAWNAAFSRLDDPLRTECADAERLEQAVVEAGAQPESWTLREPKAGRHSAGISGTVETVAGASSTVEMTLDKADDEWRIVGWAIGNEDLCAAGTG